MNVISYALWGTSPLYWTNIPFLVVANDVLFHGFHQVFFIRSDSISIPPFDFLKRCERTGKVSVEIYNSSGEDKKNLLYRMKPLWDEKTDILFPRDLDSIPTSHEARAVMVFEKSPFAVHMFRGSRQHTTLMGGLSGFFRKRIAGRIPPTFGKFVGMANPEPGATEFVDDQLYIRKTLIPKLGSMFDVLDTQTCGASDLEWSTAAQYPKNVYDLVDLSFVPTSLLEQMDSDAVSPGKAMHVSRKLMLMILATGTDLSLVFKSMMSDKRLSELVSSLR
jgi:hypothetical protein